MNSRQLRILILVALAIVAGAIWIGVSRTARVEPSAALYPALKEQLGKVTGIKLSSKGGDKGGEQAAELQSTNGEWQVKSRYNYAADKNKINALLLGLEEAQLREEKTGNADNYATLGVQDGAGGARVELVGTEPAVNLIVGKQDPTTRFSFARRVGEKQSWLLNVALTAPTESNAWLRREIANIGADRIQEVAVQPAGSARYSAIKTKRTDANFDVSGIPKGRELNSVSAADSLAQSLVNLELDDVRPVAEVAANKPAAQTSFRTFDGLVIDVQGYVLDGKNWIVVKPSFDEALAKRFHVPTTPATAPDSKAPAPAPDKSFDDAVAKGKTDADLLAKQVAGWAYEVATFKYDSLFKPLEPLLKKK